MKKYLKPDAEYVNFYSEEDITELPGIEAYDGGVEGNTSMIGDMGTGDNNEGWS